MFSGHYLRQSSPKMSRFNSIFFHFLIICTVTDVTAEGWQTLNGKAPLVIANGGMSGLYPSSTHIAYEMALSTSLSDLVLWCDVQLTSDGVGICSPDVNLQHSTDIDRVFNGSSRTYLINGVPTTGWFSVDFSSTDLASVSSAQNIFSRIPNFDFVEGLMGVAKVAKLFPAARLWLNIQHDAFLRQHNLSMRSFVISTSRHANVTHISSPEVDFLRSIVTRFRRSKTKLVFQFLGPNEIEPSLKQSYLSLLRNLTFIKTFASGILVPKYYIWPVDDSMYLQPHTSIVLDAHKKGLKVFASGFANDLPLPYNYSYDPVSEYLSFIDNSNFSVDGVLSDFPITPSAAIDCLSHMDKDLSGKPAKPLIISFEGASGDYPGCTDLAYQMAISDGVDVIDCPVQMTSDGVPFCLGTINLLERTKVATTNYSLLTMSIPELQHDNGIFSFNLTWSQIQSLRPAISSPFTNETLFRNPKFQNDGNLMSLVDFLTLANNSTSISGILINIKNAAYLAENVGLSVSDAVIDALAKSAYNNQTAKKTLIQSSDSAVLKKFKESGSKYELVYEVDENISDVQNETILEITRFADSVIVGKQSVFPRYNGFLLGETNVVEKFQAFKLPVYIQIFSNEYVSQPYDFFSDPYIELNMYYSGVGIDGVITGFPSTAAKYRRNRCLELNLDERPPYMGLFKVGELLNSVSSSMPPAEAPYPVLTEADVAESPLPPAVERRPTYTTNTPGAGAPTETKSNVQPKACLRFLLAFPVSLLCFLLF